MKKHIVHNVPEVAHYLKERIKLHQRQLEFDKEIEASTTSRVADKRIIEELNYILKDMGLV